MVQAQPISPAQQLQPSVNKTIKQTAEDLVKQTEKRLSEKVKELAALLLTQRPEIDAPDAVLALWKGKMDDLSAQSKEYLETMVNMQDVFFLRD